MISQLIDLQNYSLPNAKGAIATLYPSIPRNTNQVTFDIYNYEMLFNDRATVALIREGKTIGCFYIESPGMRSLLKKLDVQTFEMLTAASSVIRPGVAESGMMQEFIERHHHPEKRKYLVPKMEEILGETYGVMIYQEDVIKVVYHIAGLSLEEADLLRRAMSGKMRSHAAMQVLIDKFFNSCRSQKLPENIIAELWRQIDSFAGYSFCKAHSASFALLSFQVAFLKAHYPAEFMSSVLSNQGGFYSAAVYIQEAKRMGLKIKLPCINKSMYEYTGCGDTIQIGFLAVKHFSKASAEILIEERKRFGLFKSLPDFIVRTKLGYEENKLLIKCGAMDCFSQRDVRIGSFVGFPKETRITLLRLLDIYFYKMKLQNESYMDLFINDSFDLIEQVKTDKEFSLEEKCLAEYEAFDYMVTRHPLDFYSERIQQKNIIKAAEMERFNNRRIKMIGWYMASKRISTRKGDIMKFLSLEDLTGTFEAVIFPNAYSRVAEKTLSMGPYVVEGKVDGNNLIVDKLEVLSDHSIKAEFITDRAEYKYKPDDEGLTEEDFSLAKSIDIEKLRKAYAA
jgi:DNA polymerase III subunit alpha